MQDAFRLEDEARLLGLVTGLLRRLAEAEHTSLFIDPPEKVEAIYCLMRTAEMIGLAFAGDQVRRGAVDAATGGDLQGDATAIAAMLREALDRLGWNPAHTMIVLHERIAQPAP